VLTAVVPIPDDDEVMDLTGDGGEHPVAEKPRSPKAVAVPLTPDEQAFINAVLEQTRRLQAAAAEATKSIQCRVHVSPTAEMKHNQVRFLDLAGIPWRVSEFQADPDVAEAVKSGMADYADAQDFDYLFHGCAFMVRKSLDKVNRVEGDYEEFDLAALLKAEDLSHEQFVHVALLTGCDEVQDRKVIVQEDGTEVVQVTKGVRNLGILGAVDLVKRQGKKKLSLRRLLDAVAEKPHLRPCDNWLELARAAKKVFMARTDLPPMPEREVDVPGLTQFLIEVADKSPEEAERMVRDLIKAKTHALRQHNRPLLPRAAVVETVQQGRGSPTPSTSSSSSGSSGSSEATPKTPHRKRPAAEEEDDEVGFLLEASPPKRKRVSLS
jgi:hypothetical protein